MNDNEFMLFDRLQKIRETISKYGEDQFYLSFSGGKDSSVLHVMLDEALPGNRIPRVYSNTGIEYQLMVQHVKKLQQQDDRIVIIPPQRNIRKTLDEHGYPFKSKLHSQLLQKHQTGKHYKSVQRYVTHEYKGYAKQCPEILKYQFETVDAVGFKVSDKCCYYMKKNRWMNGKRKTESQYQSLRSVQHRGGRREKAVCLAFRGKRLRAFQPLAPVTDDFIEWYIKERNIPLCELYTKYGFTRTGCRGCPFNMNIQKQLDTLRRQLPNEYKACEILWKPVYEEYRRIGYRLKNEEQMTIEDCIDEVK